MPKFDLPMERAAAAGRTDISTTDSAREPWGDYVTEHVDPALHVDQQEAHDREIEIAKMVTDIRIAFRPRLLPGIGEAAFERGARAGLSAYRECYELVRMLEADWSDPHATSYDPELAALAQAALEAAR